MKINKYFRAGFLDTFESLAKFLPYILIGTAIGTAIRIERQLDRIERQLMLIEQRVAPK